EPRYNDAKSKRPDIYVFASDRRILVDVSVIHPKADSFFREAKAPLGAAKLRENHKCTHYRDLVAEEHAEFNPFVLESTGAFGNMAKQFLSTMRRYANPPDFTSSTTWESLLKRS